MPAKKRLAIFGAAENAELAGYYFLRDRPDLELKCFVTDTGSDTLLMGLPVIPEASFISEYDSTDCEIFAPYVDGRDRQNKQHQLEGLGYNFETYVSPHALVWDLAAVGKNCFVQEFNNIQYGTMIGDGCTFWAGNHIGHHGTIKPYATFTSHVTLSGRCHVGSGTYFGVNATIRDGLTIGDDIFVGQGSNITRSLEQPGVYVGSPASRLRDWR